MTPHICPFLGLRDDADTALEFASRGNYCYHARPVAAVQPDHQREFCLDERHVACPVFQRSELAPLPPEIEQKSGMPIALRWAGGGVLMVIVLVALLSWNGLGDVLAGLGQPPPASEVSEYQRSPLLDATLTPTQTGTNDLLFQFTQSPNPTFAACSRPSGWEVYVVKPTDSLLRLSIIYNLKVEDLQRANCMGAITIIRPGDQLYVPVQPTVTPSPTVTPTRRVIVYPTATPDEPDDEPPPPTQPAPTQMPPTQQLPPTNTAQPSITPMVTQPPTNTPATNLPDPTETDIPAPTADHSGGNGGGPDGDQGNDSGGLIEDIQDLIHTLAPPILQ